MVDALSEISLLVRNEINLRINYTRLWKVGADIFRVQCCTFRIDHDSIILILIMMKEEGKKNRLLREQQLVIRSANEFTCSGSTLDVENQHRGCNVLVCTNLYAINLCEGLKEEKIQIDVRINHGLLVD